MRALLAAPAKHATDALDVPSRGILACTWRKVDADDVPVSLEVRRLANVCGTLESAWREGFVMFNPNVSDAAQNGIRYKRAARASPVSSARDIDRYKAGAGGKTASSSSSSSIHDGQLTSPP
jgi:hypothetical protein